MAEDSEKKKRPHNAVDTKAPKPEPNENGEAKAKLDALGIDGMCERLRDGKSYREISEEIGVSKASVANWIAAKPERSARAQEARRISAQEEDERALKVLEDLPSDPTSGQVSKAREIAAHRRWRAKVRDPENYGDRMKVDHGLDVDLPALLAEARSFLGVVPEEQEGEPQ